MKEKKETDKRYDRLRVSLFHDEELPQEEVEKMSHRIDELEEDEKAEGGKK